MSPDELVDCMVAYQAGRLDGFERLYSALQAELGRYLAASVRNEAVVQDLVQETFLEVHRSRRTYLPPLPVRPWVFGVARNVLRRHRRNSWRAFRWAESRIEIASIERDGPQSRPIEHEDVREAVERLPPGRRDAFVLHHVHGLSFAEVAERLRIRVAAAKLRSSRAMRSLRMALGIEKRARDE